MLPGLLGTSSGASQNSKPRSGSCLPAAVCRVGKWVTKSIAVSHRLIDAFGCVQGGEEVQSRSSKGIAVPHMLIDAFGCVQSGRLGHPKAFLHPTGLFLLSSMCKGGGWISQWHCCLTQAHSCLWLCAGWEIGSRRCRMGSLLRWS